MLRLGRLWGYWEGVGRNNLEQAVGRGSFQRDRMETHITSRSHTRKGTKD